MADIPPAIQEQLQRLLGGIARMFKSPKITLIVRAPHDAQGNSTGDLVLTNDNPLFAERALKTLVIGRAKILAGTAQEMDVTEHEPTPGGLGPNFQDGGDPARYQPNRGKNGPSRS